MRLLAGDAGSIRVIPVTPLSFQPGVVTTGVEVGDDASGQLNLETLDHHSASWGPGFSSGSESRSSEARGGESSMPQDAWEIKKSSKRRCSISWRSRTVRWGSDGFLKKCESRTWRFIHGQHLGQRNPGQTTLEDGCE